MTIEDRINRIQNAFQIGKLEGELKGIIDEYQFEKDLPREYISVAFEGCSMAIALMSLKNRDSLIDWHLFVSTKGHNYLSQIHIGLGWAIAELHLPVQQYLISLDPKWQLRVLDGYGYYCGMFRRREAIRKMVFPNEIPENLYAGYNQGIGRFLFYLAQGDMERLDRNIQLFPVERHADFWRGIGIAAIFIGGINEKDAQALVHTSGEYKKQLMIGLALASNSLQKANAFGEGAQLLSSYLLDDVTFNSRIQNAEALHYPSIDVFLSTLNS